MDPFKHTKGLRDTEMPSSILCENCLGRRAKHQGPELISSTLSGRIPLPPVLKKPKESSQQEQEVKKADVRVKLSPPRSVRRDGERKHMMQNELSLLGSLCHPRIVRLLAHHHTPAHSYLVMELVSGGDLFEAISERGKFSEAEAGLMVSDVSDALNYIHCRSIVHRDLKPENLLVSIRVGRCFNILFESAVKEPVFTICGTPTYVAPEILRETGEIFSTVHPPGYGVAVDVWAQGVILYILLCGFAPFRSRDRNQEELFKLIKQAQLLFPSPYWDSKSLVRSLLQPDPAVRLTAEQTLQHKWVKAMALTCRQRALADKTQRNAADASAEPQRAQRPAQTNADKTAGHRGTLGRHDELTARGQDETKPTKQLKETSTVNVMSSQNEELTPLVGTCSQEKLELTSAEQHEILDPGPKLPIADRGDLIQSGFSAAQTESSSLQPNSEQESPPGSPASTQTALQIAAGPPPSKPAATQSLLQQHINTQPHSGHPPKTPN
uniref:Serine/threonine-protein kinase DCLK3 n=1 Tax=Kryptolebias marmoratus TaxID=37003 RepID=A0A3Q2ZQ39_KRYMA